jgi:hypothetical protein
MAIDPMWICNIVVSKCYSDEPIELKDHSMTNRIFDVRRAKGDAATLSAGIAGSIALAFCCGGGILAAMFGLSALAAFFVNPWFLIPVVLVSGGVVYWRANRRHAACEVPSDRRITSDEW